MFQTVRVIARVKPDDVQTFVTKPPILSHLQLEPASDCSLLNQPSLCIHCMRIEHRFKKLEKLSEYYVVNSTAIDQGLIITTLEHHSES